MNEVRALVLDGHLPSALACVRSLNKRGIKVTCGAERRTALAIHSKHADETWIYPSPLDDQATYAESVLEKLRTMGDCPVIFCMSDNTLLPLAKRRARLERVGCLVLPDDKSLEIAFDKFKTLKLAEHLDVPTPLTFFIENPNDFESALGELEFPCVIKPRQSCLWVDGRGIRGKTEIAENRGQAVKIVEQIYKQTNLWPLLQERLTGQEFGVFGLWQNGKWMAKFAHKRLRSLDPSGGASCLRQSIDMPSDMASYAERLMSELKWQGPAMIEFKLDRQDGSPKLMEINGRFWGSLALSVASGVDFPYLTDRQARGKAIEPIDKYEIPVTARSFLADCASLIAIFTRPRGVTRLKALKDFIFIKVPNLVYDVESWDDLKPAFWQVIDAIARKI